MIVNGGITGGTCQRPPLPLGNVLQGTGVSISLTQPEINAVDKVARSTPPIRDKVGRLDITMDQMARMHQFHSFQHLIGDHEDCLETETTAAFVELIFEGGSKKVHDHEIIGVLGTEVVDFGKAGSILQFTVDFVFVAELGAAGSMLFEFYSHLLVYW